MSEDIFDKFLRKKGHNESTWLTDYNKNKCPECFALHNKDEKECSVCEWSPKYKNNNMS